ncbi:hypothetical protein DIPPA_32954 [Diplonema papillatum]|nr:hypothetical protein DIPPA_32954 [Diplonema papillatum]
MPMPPVAKPTPDVALHTRGQEAIEYAHLNKQQAEDEHSTTRDGAKLTDKLKTKVHVLEAKMAVSSAEKQLKKDEKKLRKADEATHKKYKQLFPSPLDEPLALFKCTYIDGKAQSSTGFLFVTDSNLRYAGDMADPIRETIPWKTIASVEDVGKPARINVYTVERKVYQFTGIKTAKKGIEDESPHADALNWIDHMWRSTGTAPNPAATYFTS